MKIIKKNGRAEEFDGSKIINAIRKSANRVLVLLTEEEEQKVVDFVVKSVAEKSEVVVSTIHNLVEVSLELVNPKVGQAYKEYRDYKNRFNDSFSTVLKDAERIIYGGDKENANKDSCINSTKMALTSELVGKELYLNYELPNHLSYAHRNLDMYIHDLGHRWYNMINCCLLDVGNILKDGFTLNYNKIEEPNSIEKAIDLFGDIIFVASGQQYGGLTTASIDDILAPYVEKSYNTLIAQGYSEAIVWAKLSEIVYKKLKSLQYKISTVCHSAGQTPFLTFSFGTNTTEFGRIISREMLRVRENHMAIFPKLVLLCHDDINTAEGSPNYDIYLQGIRCSMKRLYPDYCSANKGKLKEIYDRCGTIVSPMGCRAYLSEFVDSEGKERYVGRFNLGCISLALPRYAIMANGDKNEFFRLVDKYFDYAMEVHNITYDKLRKTKANSNPLLFMEGGCLVKLKAEDTIEKALESCTYSIGYIGLEEVSYLLTGKHLHEDNSLAKEVLEHLNAKVEKAKKDTGKLIALYATPSEGMMYKMATADREAFGIIEGVTDKEYYENSFHVGSRFTIPALDKQEIENPLFHLSNGGHITYCEYPMVDNFEAYKAIIDNHVRLGQYSGVNVLVSNCNNCKASGDFKDVCSECGSEDITTISRCCG